MMRLIRSVAALAIAAALGADTVQFGAALSPAAFDTSTTTYVISGDQLLPPLLAWFFPAEPDKEQEAVRSTKPVAQPDMRTSGARRDTARPSTTPDGLFDETLVVDAADVPAAEHPVALTETSTIAAVSLNPGLAREVVKKIAAAGFGKLEIIRLILISERAIPAPADLRRLAEQRARGMSLRDIAARCGVTDYDNAVWAESRRIYAQIYRVPPP